MNKQLSKYADAANKWHHEAVEHERSAILCAKKSGDALNNAQRLVIHGNWEAWVKVSFEGSTSKARVYCSIANNWLWLEAKVSGGTVCTIEDARRAIELHNEEREDAENASSGKVRVKRLREQLESVRPGLSTRGIIEQSDCFIFQGGRVITYNDEVACSRECDLPIEGALQPQPLLNLLDQMEEKHLEISVTGNELRLSAPNRPRRAGITINPEILLPIDDVSPPASWKPLPDDFTEAVDVVSRCAGLNWSREHMDNVHIHPKHMEASDNYQVARYPITLGTKQSILVMADSLKHIIPHNMTSFALTKEWLHFRNYEGMVMSCRYSQKAYPRLDKLLRVKGASVSLPNGLKKAAARASLFQGDEYQPNRVAVELRPEEMHVRGRSENGWYSETLSIDYQGKPAKFLIDSKLLTRIADHEECKIENETLAVDTGRFVYAVKLTEGECPNV